ncbi:MAG: class B sortase [Christensenellales bacterium]|jgi:sortase B
MKKKLAAFALALILLSGCTNDPGNDPANTPGLSATPDITGEEFEPVDNPVPSPMDEAEPSPEPGANTPGPAAELPFAEAALAEMPRGEEYLALHKSNPEVLGWITVPNTNIDYAAALTTDNEKYLHTTLLGEESKAGAIFFDYRTDKLLSGRHLILYGHNMKAGTMFHDLNSYKHKNFFENNRIITLWAGSEKREYEVYAAYVATEDIYFIRMYFKDDAHFLDYMTGLQALSKFSTDVELTADDQILTLVTCTYEEDNARFVVQARRVR